MRTLNAAPPIRLDARRPNVLRPPRPRGLNAPLDRRLASPRPRRLPRAAGTFLPGFAGLAEELDETEVQVGYMDPGAESMYHGGVGPVGAFDLQSLLTPRNLLIAGAVAVGASMFLFKRSRRA